MKESKKPTLAELAAGRARFEKAGRGGVTGFSRVREILSAALVPEKR